MKKVLALLLVCALSFGCLAACGAKTDLEAKPAATTAPAAAETSTETTEAPAEEAKVIKVGLVLTTSGLGDNNFNDMAYHGLELAKEAYGIEFDYLEPSSADEITAFIRDFAQDGSYDLIIGLANEAVTGIEEASEAYPEQKFAIVDNIVEGDNICSIFKNGAEQTFLAGVLAGLLTTDTSLEKINEDKVVGAIIGADFPNLIAMESGYVCGARFYDPSVKVLCSTVGDFSDVNTAKEMSLSIAEQKADVIMNLDGGGVGIWSAAEEKDFYGIGCGSNQNTLSDCIVATAGYTLSQVILNQVGKLVDGTWEAGTYSASLSHGEFALLWENASVQVSDEIKAKVEQAAEWFASANTVLPTTREAVDAWVEANAQA